MTLTATGPLRPRKGRGLTRWETLNMTTETTTTRTINATASGLLVYIDADTGMAACIGPAGLRRAHDAALAVGCHPYAATTAWTLAYACVNTGFQAIALLPTLTTSTIATADALMVEEWLDWCDEVFARYEEHSAEESIASSAQQTGAITDARYIDEVNGAIAAAQAA